jgi:hypothetical protein
MLGLAKKALRTLRDCDMQVKFFSSANLLTIQDLQRTFWGGNDPAQRQGELQVPKPKGRRHTATYACHGSLTMNALDEGKNLKPFINLSNWFKDSSSSFKR